MSGRSHGPRPALSVAAAAAALLAAPGLGQSGVRAWGQLSFDSHEGEEAFVEVAAGGYITLARRADGTLAAWGRSNLCAVPSLPPGVSYAEMWSSWGQVITRASDGSIVSWGVDVPPPPPGLTYVSFAPGYWHTAALLSDGSVIAWGGNYQGQCNVPPNLGPVAAITSGHSFTAALLANGRIVAWGDPPSIPAPPPGLAYMEVAAGDYHLVARLSDGSLLAWGDNSHGQCNIPSLPPGVSVVAMDSEKTQSIALLSDGSLLAWPDPSAPSAPAGTAFVEVAAGSFHTVARLDDGRVICWGSNTLGECNLPALALGTQWRHLAAGSGQDQMISSSHGLALRSDGQLFGWGWDLAGQARVPTLPAGRVVRDMSAGGGHSLAALDDGSILAWGNDGDGQCQTPTLPPGLTCVGVAAGVNHSLALLSDGSVKGWGGNESGQSNDLVPPPGVVIETFDAGGAHYLYPPISYTRGHSLASSSDGSILPWGNCSMGLCQPPQLPPGASCVAVDTGAKHSLALLSDGSVVAWGEGSDGQCDVPVPPVGVSYVAISAGQYHSLARRSDGVIVAWGRNVDGECNVPLPPPGTAYSDLAAGAAFSAAVYAPDGDVTTYCTAKPSSLPGCTPQLWSAGAPSASSGAGFHVTAAPLPARRLGLFFYTTHGAASAPIQNVYGWLCVAQVGVFRILPPANSGGTSGACDGRLQLDFNAYFATQAKDPTLVAGARVDLQAWYRDPPNPGGANLTDAIAFTMVP